MVASWAPAAQGPSHDVTGYAYWAHPFYFCKLHTFSFFCLVSVFFAQEGPPNEFFDTFFGRVFGPARVRISYVFSLRRDPEQVFLHFFRKRFRTRACTDFLGKRTQERLFLQCQKSECKISCRVRGMGPPQGPAFACTVTTINKTKQKKLKKT